MKIIVQCDSFILKPKKILECSSKGDKRFSAFYANLTLYGKTQSIENHYQLSKRFGDIVPINWKESKGKIPTHFEVCGQKIDVKYLSGWYDLLWMKYLDKNPNLVEFAKKFDDFNDIFKGKNTLNCQADSIKKYIKRGREGVITEHSSLIKILKNINIKKESL